MTNSSVVPYLFFGGRCEEALAFYKEVAGAEVEMVMRHKESPDPAPPGMLAPGWEDKVMHATFRIGASTILASDGHNAESTFSGFSLALYVDNEAEAHRVFAGLSEGGTVTLPLGKTFWSPCFGMLTDRFGIGWMVMVQMPEAA